mmetsp:Transcript_13365/g.29482  ORF Transcript_13365/g.29482 Transcript_13365/m.29482 type:complete len:145 (-) Transcript_13365:397-831(-)
MFSLTFHHVVFLSLAVNLLIKSSTSFHVHTTSRFGTVDTPLFSSPHHIPVATETRTDFLRNVMSVTAGAAVWLPPAVSHAKKKEIPEALKNTKEDPSYQTCVSVCLYDCTKPKGDTQKSRAECIPECKQKCATSKQQLLIGTPK